MPFVNIKLLGDEKAPTEKQKEELIKGATDLLVKVLGKDPTHLVVVIDEVPPCNWGIGGVPRSKTLK